MTLPVWGCPWHGRVDRVGGVNQLTLPNGATMTYPTSIISNRRSGDTYLVQVPGVPEVVRTPEELIADEAAGRQWWNKAILSSQDFHLYGKAISGWIYCDPAGARWRVKGLTSVPVTGNEGSWPVTLERFGEFVGAPESHAHTVALADLGQAAPTLTNIASRQLQVRDIAPDGSRALLAIVATRGISSESGMWPEGSSERWMPALGWLELSISGVGAAATLSLSVLHTRAETMGVYDFVNAGTGALEIHWLEVTEEVISPSDPHIVEYTPVMHITSTEEEGEVAGWDEFGRTRPGTQTSHQKRTGIILAVWYTASGGYQRMTYDVAWTEEEDVSPITWASEGVDRTEDGVLVSQYTLSGSQTSARHHRRRATLRLDGAEVDAFELDAPTLGEHYYERDVGWWQVVNGDSMEPQPFPDAWSALTGITPAPELEDASFVKLDQLLFGPAFPVTDRRTVCPYELSNHVWSLLVSRPVSGTAFAWTWRPAHGPAGATDGATTDRAYVDGLRLYGSWCPVTHQLARSDSRVFWI